LLNKKLLTWEFFPDMLFYIRYIFMPTKLWRIMFKHLTLAAALALTASTVSATTQIELNSKNSVSFNQPVRDDYIAKKQLELMAKDFALPKTQPLYLILDTPGGSVFAGNQFIDFVKSLNRPVHTITLFAASMGYQISQELGKRYITTTGTLMSHRGAVSGLSGQVPGELNARLKMLEDSLVGMNERAAKRVGMSLSDYQNAIINELWVSGEAAVKSHHADEIASVSCDKSLSGTYFDEVATVFGPIQVEYSKCPLISSPIGFKFGNSAIASNSKGALAARSVLGAFRKVKLEY
jgi:ATP-dependent protease ClpP protease subunit